MDRQSAQIVAQKALVYIVSDSKVLGALQAGTGVDGTDMREGAENPEFLAGLLDFLLENEELLLSFCQIEGFAPETPQQARAALPGAAPEW